MTAIRTDLAAEAHRLWQETTGRTTRLRGVRARDSLCRGLPLTRVEILDREGAEALGKPRGTYLTLDLKALSLRDEPDFQQAAEAIGKLLAPLVPREGPVLVAGLGNRAMTADALGPLTVDNLLVTRHMGDLLPELRPVSALAAGVLGDTGLEAGEWISGAVRAVRPDAVLLVDALAARSVSRLGSTVQLSDTGLIPGSGVGNHRTALNRETLGVPVVSLGVPTVVDAATLARDLLGRDEKTPPAPLGQEAASLFVTQRDIDQQIRLLGRLLGLGITLALQQGLRYRDALLLSR